MPPFETVNIPPPIAFVTVGILVGAGGEGKEGGAGGPAGAGGKGKGKVISVDWYDGAEGLLHQRVPTLCVALEGGTVQMSRGVDDPDPVVVNSHMVIRQARKKRLH